MFLAQRDQRPREPQRRILIPFLGGRSQGRVRGRHRQPRLAIRKTEIGFARNPRHRRAAGIAPLRIREVEFAHRIANLRPLDRPIRQPKLFTLIEQHRALQRHQQRQRQFGQRRVRLHQAAVTRDGARNIMVRERHARPQASDVAQKRVVLREHLRLERTVLEERKRVARVQAVIGAREMAEQTRLLRKLAEDEAVLITVHDGADLIEHHAVLRQIAVANTPLQVRCMRPVVRGALGHRHRRIVAQLRVMQIAVRDVEPEPVDAAVEPELQHVKRRCQRLGIVEIELRLALQELVKIILPPHRMIGPCRPAENGEPIVRRRAVLARIGPHIPIRLRALT